MWLTPADAHRDLTARGYADEDFDSISSSHEEVGLVLIAQSDRPHDLHGLVRLIRIQEIVDNRGEV